MRVAAGPFGPGMRATTSQNAGEWSPCTRWASSWNQQVVEHPQREAGDT